MLQGTQQEVEKEQHDSRCHVPVMTYRALMMGLNRKCNCQKQCSCVTALHCKLQCTASHRFGTVHLYTKFLLKACFAPHPLPSDTDPPPPAPKRPEPVSLTASNATPRPALASQMLLPVEDRIHGRCCYSAMLFPTAAFAGATNELSVQQGSDAELDWLIST